MAKIPWTDFQDMDKSKPKLKRLNFNLLMKEIMRTSAMDLYILSWMINELQRVWEVVWRVDVLHHGTMYRTENRRAKQIGSSYSPFVRPN